MAAVRLTRTVRKNVINNCFANRPGLTFRWFDMHQQAWSGVDFDYGAALLVQGAGDVLSNQVNTCDIQTDSSGCKTCNIGHVRVNFVSTVKGNIAVALDECFNARWNDAVGFKSLSFKFQALVVA